MTAPAPDRDSVESLKQFYDEAEILAAWQSVAAALVSRASEKITITSKSQDGRSASGLELSTAEQKQEFVRVCRQALFEIDPDTYPDPGYGRTVHVDSSSRPVMM